MSNLLLLFNKKSIKKPRNLFVYQPRNMAGAIMTGGMHFPKLSLGSLFSMALDARLELSRDLTVWGADVEQRIGPKLWENYTGPTPSPLRWSFWAAVAEQHEIPEPDIGTIQLAYHETLLSVASKMRLYDASLERLYRVHYAAASIYSNLKDVLDLQDLQQFLYVCDAQNLEL